MSPHGLDPAGIQEFRLIKDENRTVLLSSHLLDEVEKTCAAIAIVDHGRVVTQHFDPIRLGGQTEVAMSLQPQSSYLKNLLLYLARPVHPLW